MDVGSKIGDIVGEIVGGRAVGETVETVAADGPFPPRALPTINPPKIKAKPNRTIRETFHKIFLFLFPSS